MVKLDSRILERDALIRYFARENIIPVKAPYWSKYPYILRRVEKRKRGMIGTHLTGNETTAELLKILVIYDDESCRKVREEIKRLRKSSM